MFAVITDRTPNRATVQSIHRTHEAATEAAERYEPAINGMPAEVMPIDPAACGAGLEPGDRAWHDGSRCWG